MGSNEAQIRHDFHLGPARPPDPNTQADPVEERARQMLAISKEFRLDLTLPEARKRAKAELEAEARQAALKAPEAKEGNNDNE